MKGIPLARCSLSVSHPKFERNIEKYLAVHPALRSGLHTLCALVLKDRKLSGWVCHPMPGFPEHQRKVWKWDFKPDDSAHSATRKGWRLFAYAADPNAPDPIPAVAFYCYDKADEPKGNPAKWLAAELKKFLRIEAPPVVDESERFRHSTQADGKLRSICCECYETVFVSAVNAEIEMAELSHTCAVVVPPDSNSSPKIP